MNRRRRRSSNFESQFIAIAAIAARMLESSDECLASSAATRPSIQHCFRAAARLGSSSIVQPLAAAVALADVIAAHH